MAVAFELDTSYEDLLIQKLTNVPAQDKRETSLIYQATAANTIETAQVLFTLLNYENQMFADTAPRENLIRRAAERGLSPTPATKAIRKGVFNIDVPIGARFSQEEYNYVVIEKIENGIFKLECETVGEVGNFEAGQLIPIDYITGLETAQLTDLLIPGENEEDTEAFRSRYFNSFESVSFGGNRADYKERVGNIPGVGGARIYRAKYGGGTVGVTIIDSTYSKPSTALVELVQQLVDPLDSQGDGVGLAPIDHIVTISAVNETVVNIATTLTLQSNWSFADVESAIKEVIDGYFKESAELWAKAVTKQEDNTGLIVRISQIETRILGIDGVIDIANTKLNGTASNLELDKEAIPKRGTVSG
ncbi:baseplate J/gp47 family protein [Lysinibacillus sphaericus]|uniref:baseplate J/gp47 family protein n=1 Tax=Lysinibacillus sphaericus TaxID=1421 RepID=UPI00055DB797|nr:baseplate J/gp47 family protein [Lysinibacillus sphaericus]